RLSRTNPAVAEHVPELMSELICELDPVERADVDDNPCRAWWIVVQPDCRGPSSMVVDPKHFRLLVRPDLYPGQTDLSNPQQDASPRGRRRRAPVASQFQGRTE